jgi:tetratricopeptide (TPR) repeat protein
MLAAMSKLAWPRVLPWFLLAGLCLLRLAHWGAPMIGDEAFMVRTYANKPIAYAATHYQTTNNHFLLSMVLHGIDAISPRRLLVTLAHPGALQFPSMLASILALLLLYRLVSEIYDKRVALFASLAYGLAYWQLLYSHMLRGYAVSCLLVLVMVWVLRRGVKEQHRWLWALPPLLAALHYLVPSNVYFTGALAIWALFLLKKYPAARWPVIGAFLGGGLLTLVLLWPVLGAMRQRAVDLQELIVNGDAARTLAAFRVLGWFVAYRIWFLVVAGLGVWTLWRSKNREGLALPLCLALLPLLLMTLHRQAPYARHFIPGVAGWAILFGLGIDAALRRWPRISSNAAVLLVLLIAAPEARAFWEWNRGHDLRGAFVELAELTRSEDDFAVVVAAEPEHGHPEALSWEYYAIAANMAANEKVFRGGLPKYLYARQVYLLTRWTPRAAQKVGQVGKIQIWRRDYADKADGYIAERRYAQAARELRKLRQQDPSNVQLRFRLGLAYYLAFEEKKAVPELQYAAEHDSENPLAAFYLADALTALGRPRDAARWYGWYKTSKVRGMWGMLKRVNIAVALKQSDGDPRAQTAAEWDDLATRAVARGAYERALAALARAQALEPKPQRSGRYVEVLIQMRRYAEAARVLRGLAKSHPGTDVLNALAEVLYQKYDEEGARAAIAEVLHRDPESKRARRTLERIDRG